MAGKVGRVLGLIMLVAGFTAAASELRVEPRTVRVGESAVITVELEGSFASLDLPPLGLTNLSIQEGPFESTQFEWINGRSRRRKIIQFRVRATRAGEAAVGSINLIDRDGNRLDLERVVVRVSPEQQALPAGELSDLESFLRRSDWIGVIADVSAGEVWDREQLDVTWYLYANDVHLVRVLEGPDVSGFWSEDLAIEEGSREIVRIGDVEIQRVPIRRMALFPLKSGDQRIGPVEVAVTALEPASGRELFSVFDRRLLEYRRSAAPIAVTVHRLPREFDAVGTLTMQCSAPSVPTQGPVSMTVTIEGRGNLRSTRAPSWLESPAVPFEIEDIGVTVLEREGRILMRRRWRYLLFPRAEDYLRIPGLTVSSFDTSLGHEAALECGGRTVRTGSGPESLPPAKATEFDVPDAPRVEDDRPTALAGLLGAFAMIGVLLYLRMRRRQPARLSELEELVGDPRELRGRVHEFVTSSGFEWNELLSSRGEAGENLRSLVSLIDVMEKEPWEIERSRRELRRRLREFLSAFTPVERDGRV